MTPEEVLTRAEAYAELVEALGSLPQPVRQVLALRFGFEPYEEGRTLEEVGVSIGKSKERARQIQEQGLSALRRFLGVHHPPLFYGDRRRRPIVLDHRAPRAATGYGAVETPATLPP